MIIYGTRANNIHNGQIINVDCPNCKKNTSMIYSVFGKYAHIYWIPLFPYGKATYVECNSCKKTYEFKELPESITAKLAREKEKQPARTPVWMFSGLFILAGIIAFISFNSYQNELDEAEYIKNPKVGDVYYIKVDEKNYTSSRVDKVTRTEIYLTNNDYGVDLSSGIDDIDVKKNYTTSKDTLSIIQIQEAFKSKMIISIKRN